MSSEERSRKALSKDEIKRLDYELRHKNESDFLPWLEERKGDIQFAPDDFIQRVELAFNKVGVKENFPEWFTDLLKGEGVATKEETTLHLTAEESKAPAIVKELSKSEIPKPPESQDVIYLSELEISLERRINTLDFMLVPDPDAPIETHQGPWIERCLGRDPESRKMRVVKIRAKRVEVEPWMVMQYLGSVVSDHQSVHTNSLVFKGTRHGYVFDRFYVDPRNGKRYERCCLLTDRVHQSGLMYEKAVDKRTRKAYARIRRIRGAMGQPLDDPMYRIIGYKEADYRDLKRLYERHLLSGPNEALAEDIGLKMLIG